MVGFSEAVKRGFTKTFSWEGRASRAEYWWFYLFSLACLIPSVALTVAWEVPVVLPVWLFLFVPSLGVFVRRMHDCGRSGWNWLWPCIPLIGVIVLLALLCDRGDSETNEYGWPPGSRADW
ncbi:DUF805 domain-containing protein [Streptomyces pseudoechinosporeus]